MDIATAVIVVVCILLGFCLGVYKSSSDDVTIHNN